ncbi:Calnexin [Hypsibius exemplaris]|uniref:Large subunit GTPase 1 homolog n=1 Tax=Hypsibius exemplaris TaxID=2072580 RepID=A0A9X6NFT9_HYPEX|nr:Calnexin [Hypsibius exemplaris]
MPQHAKKSNNSNLGRTLIRDRFKARGRTEEQWVSPADAARSDNQEEALLKSVTASSDLDEFLATARMAGTEFEAERHNLKLIVPNPKAGVLSSSEQDAIRTLQDKHKNLLCIPRRPKWDKSTTPEELDTMEKTEFLEWRKLLAELCDIETLTVTPYEKNLEVWKQMWRVLERSDIVVQIVDARNPLLYWSADLAEYVAELDDRKDRLILVNKADLLPEPQRQIWATYFNEVGLKAVFFSATDVEEEEPVEDDEKKKARHEESPEPLDNGADWSDTEEGEDGEDDTEEGEDDTEEGEEAVREREPASAAHEKLPEPMDASTDPSAKPWIAETSGSFHSVSHVFSRGELVDLFKTIHSGKDTVVKGVTTVGFVGYPNVGKSSTLNALMQHKRVSVSSTPGKTKHFQTMYLDQDLMLCDSPGLVMPSFAMSAAEMVVSGILPIDQMRDYLPPLNLICSRIPRVTLEVEYGISLKFVKEYGVEYHIIPPPTGDELLSAYADMRGFVTARGLPDIAKAARHILKDYVNGRILYFHAPPTMRQEDFYTYPELVVDHSDTLEPGPDFGAVDGQPSTKVKTVGGRMNKDFFATVTAGIHQQRDGLSHVRGPLPEVAAGPRTKRHFNKNKKQKLRNKFHELDCIEIRAFAHRTTRGMANWRKILWTLTIFAALAVAPSHCDNGDDDAEELSTGNSGQPGIPTTADEPALYELPVVDEKDAYFFEPFATSELPKRWVLSQSKKDQADKTENEKYDGEWAVESTNISRMAGDFALVLKSAAKHHGIAAKLDRPFTFSGKPFVFQYDVKFANGQECGGAYVKLLQKDSLNNLADLNDKTPYTIMFGPDKCGKEAHLRFIFQHKHPKTGVFQEKHWKEPSSLKIEELVSSKRTHLYTLVINTDSSFHIYVDQKEVGTGSLLKDFNPPVNPVAEIEDPEDKKPQEWDERKTIADPFAQKPESWDEEAPQKIADPAAVKPDGWLEDEPEMVHDLAATQPEDWDVEMDGEWEAPLVENPKCKGGVGCGKWTAPLIDNPKCKSGGCGPWSAPMVDNPDYKGKWAPRKIPNPDYFEDDAPYKMTPIDAVALELWSISNEVSFDNFLVTEDLMAVADRIATATWKIKAQQESAAESEGGLSYTIIGVIVATVVGLLGIVLARTYFRKQNLPAGGGDSSAAAAAEKSAGQQTRKLIEKTVAAAEKTAEEAYDDLPPLEGDEPDEGSGDNAESGASAESGSEVEEEEEEEAPVIPAVRTNKAKSRARRE